MINFLFYFQFLIDFKIFFVLIKTMTITLNEIISGCYLELRNTGSSGILMDKYHLAGLILGRMYETYEKHGEHHVFMDIDFFLKIVNPIKHILNIINNTDQMSIDEAILIEMKSLKSSQNNISGKVHHRSENVTLYEIYEKIYPSIDIHKFDQLEYKMLIVERIESELIELRLEGRLSEDDKSILIQNDKSNLLSSVIERKILGESLGVSISDIYFEISNRNNSSILLEEMSLLRNSLNSILHEVKSTKETCLDKFHEVHEHVDHLGNQTFDMLVGEQHIITSPVPRNTHKNSKYPRMFDNK